MDTTAPDLRGTPIARVREIIAELDAFIGKHPTATLADALYETSDQYRLREWNAVIRVLIHEAA